MLYVTQEELKADPKVLLEDLADRMMRVYPLLEDYLKDEQMYTAMNVSAEIDDTAELQTMDRLGKIYFNWSAIFQFRTTYAGVLRLNMAMADQDMVEYAEAQNALHLTQGALEELAIDQHDEPTKRKYMLCLMYAGKIDALYDRFIETITNRKRTFERRLHLLLE